MKGVFLFLQYDDDDVSLGESTEKLTGMMRVIYYCTHRRRLGAGEADHPRSPVVDVEHHPRSPVLEAKRPRSPTKVANH